MKRRQIMQALLSLPFVRWFDVKRPPCQDDFIVSTLEHEGWGYVDPQHHGESKYVNRWTFDTKQEAEAFVRSLMPEIFALKLRKREYPLIDQVRSGYRGAVRAQFRDEIVRMEVNLVEVVDGVSKQLLLDTPMFWDISNAWAYLENIRINGEPISRWSSPNKCGLSAYLTQPFRKGNPEITYVE